MVKQRKLPRERKSWFDFFCALPAIIFFLVFTYYPVAELFRISLTDWNLSRATYKYVEFKNYNWLFFGNGAKTFFPSLQVTALYTLGEVAFTLVGGMLLALLFDRMTRFFNWMRIAVVIPKYILVSSTAMIFMWLYNDMYGVFNYILSLFGVEGLNWLGGKDTALFSLILFSGWRTIGYAMLIYLSAIKGISEQYLEAASIDGANAVQKFFRIKLPLLAPTTLFLVVTTVVSSMKVFQAVDILTNGGPYKATNVMVYYIYKLAFEDHRLDRASAMGFVFFIILLIFTAATMKWSNHKVNYDA